MTLGGFLDGAITFFGGAATIITIATVVSAYNQYLTRKYLREIRDLINKHKPTQGVVAP